MRRSTYRATSTGDKNFSYNNLYYEDDWNFSESDRIHNHHHNGFMYLTAYKFVFFIFLKEVRISNTETWTLDFYKPLLFDFLLYNTSPVLGDICKVNHSSTTQHIIYEN